MVNMSQTFSSQSGFFGTDDIVKRIFSDTFLDRSHPCRSIFFAIGWHSAMKNKKYTMHSRNWNWKASRCLKITEKVSFNITSEAIYVYILSGQKFIKKWSILASFLKAWRSNSAKSAQFWLDKNWWKNSNATLWAIFKHCAHWNFEFWHLPSIFVLFKDTYVSGNTVWPQACFQKLTFWHF